MSGLFDCEDEDDFIDAEDDEVEPKEPAPTNRLWDITGNDQGERWSGSTGEGIERHRVTTLIPLEQVRDCATNVCERSGPEESL